MSENSEGLEQLTDDMNAFNQLEVIRLNKRVKELERAGKRVCGLYDIADCWATLTVGDFVEAIVELGKLCKAEIDTE